MQWPNCCTIKLTLTKSFFWSMQLEPSLHRNSVLLSTYVGFDLAGCSSVFNSEVFPVVNEWLPQFHLWQKGHKTGRSTGFVFLRNGAHASGVGIDYSWRTYPTLVCWWLRSSWPNTKPNEVVDPVGWKRSKIRILFRTWWELHVCQSRKWCQNQRVLFSFWCESHDRS